MLQRAGVPDGKHIQMSRQCRNRCRFIQSSLQTWPPSTTPRTQSGLQIWLPNNNIHHSSWTLWSSWSPSYWLHTWTHLLSHANSIKGYSVHHQSARYALGVSYQSIPSLYLAIVVSGYGSCSRYVVYVFALVTLITHRLTSACILTFILPYILNLFAGCFNKTLSLKLSPSPPPDTKPDYHGRHEIGLGVASGM